MTYIALKPCSFAGLNYRIGESVPDVVLHPGAIKSLVKMGVIAEGVNKPEEITPISESAPVETCTITVNTDAGETALVITTGGIQDIFTVLTGKVEEAEAVINGMTEGDALFLLHMADGRKSIKAAAEARAKAIEEAGEQ